jgi:hypothetical protein
VGHRAPLRDVVEITHDSILVAVTLLFTF